MRATPAIVAAACVRPAWRESGLPVPGPDEDPFTMAIGALQELRRGAGPTSGHVGELHVTGATAGIDEVAVRSALGSNRIALVIHPGEGRGLREALAACRDRVMEGEPSTTVAVQLGGPESGKGGSRAAGAFAIALEWGPGPGLELPENLGDAVGASIGEGGTEGGGTVGQSSERLGLFAAAPLGSSTDASNEPSSAAGRSPGLKFTGEVRWVGNWLGATSARSLPNRTPGGVVDSLNVVSEGAYVPRARYLENLPSRWRLAADECGDCGHVTFPQRGRCHQCGRSGRLQEIELPRDGTVEATTTVGVGAQPTEFDRQVSASGPYEVVIVQLARGARGTFQVADALAGSIAIGARVKLSLRRLYAMEGEWRYGLKATPLPEG